MNILITGGAGFIGSHLCRALLEKDCRVLCLDNLLTGSQKNIAPFIDNDNFQFVNHDVIKPFLKESFLPSKIDLIYHLASPASPNEKSPYSYLSYPLETLLVNSQGTKNLLDLAKKKKARLVFASTSEVYGDPDLEHHPQSEDYWGNVNPNGPRSCYDESKRFGEAVVMTYRRKFNLDTRIVRIFNTYGPQMLPEDGRVVSNFIVQALRAEPITIYGRGTQTRSLCYVSDMIKGLLKMGRKEDIGGEVVNLGNTQETQIIELARLVKQLTKSKSETVYNPLPENDPVRRRPDISKAKKLLDWEPKVKLQAGLQKTIAYFKKILQNGD